MPAEAALKTVVVLPPRTYGECAPTTSGVFSDTMNVEEQRAISEAAETANEPAVAYERGPDETATHAVVRALHSALDIPETEMVPIYEAVDPDALDSLFRSTGRRSTPSGVDHVVFEYESRRVRVESGGSVYVY